MMCETNQASFCKVPSGCQHFDVFFLGDLCTDAVFGEISTVLAARLLRLCYLRSGWVWEEQIFVAWVTGEVSDRGAEKMFKLEHPHFVTGNFTPQNVFLGDREYGLALDCLVKACTDLLLLNSDQPDCKVLLGKRIVEPQPDWWYVGGRMKPGERPEQSIARLVKRELHLLVEPSRFQPLGTHSYAWARRQQPPMDNGTCDISVVLTLVLLPGEADRIHMDEKEYAEFRWFSISEIIAGENFHPALRASARDIWQRQAWQKLVREVRSGGSTESIAETAKRLVSLSH